MNFPINFDEQVC